jgi:3-isopropylmalate dehydrogenase
MFEPIGGSAPKYAGKNVINPLAAIGAAQMMLAHLGLQKAAQQVEKAIREVVKNKIKDLTAGKMGFTTQEVGDLVVENL